MTSLAIEIGGHHWAQALPLAMNMLVCGGCAQRRPIRGGTARPCAEVIAERWGGEARGDFVVVPL